MVRHFTIIQKYLRIAGKIIRRFVKIADKLPKNYLTKCLKTYKILPFVAFLEALLKKVHPLLNKRCNKIRVLPVAFNPGNYSASF